MSVIITGAESAKALIAARSLGRRGVKVSTGGISRFSPAFFSRYSGKHFLYPDPGKNEEKFIEELEKFIRKNPHDVLIPTHSTETYVISKHKRRLEEIIKVPVPDYEKILTANNKERIIKLADRLKIRTPKTVSIKDMNELEDVSREMSYPAVIKLLDKSSGIGLSYVKTRGEMVKKYRETVKNFKITPDKYPVVQEFVGGTGYGTSVLYNKGKIKAIFTHKRLREYPCTGGPSTLRESVKNTEMESATKKIMDCLGWHGVAMAEFKMNEAKEPVLIEVNPRFWGSMNMAIRSGVDFPYLLYKMALDGDVEKTMDYMLGLKTRFLLLDIKSFPGYWKKSKNRLKLLKDYVKSENVGYDIESLDDLKGSFFYYLFLLNKIRE